MDHPSYRPVPPPDSRRSQRMEQASLAFGFFGLSLFCLVYPPLVCGSLAIMFALLSRGGTNTMTPRARTGLLLGSFALGIVLLMLVYTLVFAETYYGGLDNMMREFYNGLGIDYDMLLRSGT